MSIAQKMPIRPAFFSLFLALSWGVPSQAIPKKQPSANSTCNPLGRVVQAQGYPFRTGQIICAGQKLHGSATAMLSLFCFDTLTNVTFNGADQDLAQKCQSRPIRSRLQCDGTQDFVECSRSISIDELALVRPFGETIIESRPTLEWTSIQGATHYKVVVDGRDFTWEKILSENRISYPKKQPELKSGNSYKITIFSYQQDKLIATHRTALYLLPEEEEALIEQAIIQLRQFPLTRNEFLVDLDRIYMLRDLLDESINLLEQSAPRGPELDKLLAQRYEDAGFPELSSGTNGAQLPTKTILPQK